MEPRDLPRAPHAQKATPDVMFGVSIVVGLAALIAYSALEPVACRSQLVAQAIKTGNAQWCLEFWIERYQTLIAALITLASAAWAAILLTQQNGAISSQIAEAKRQSAIDLHARLVSHWKDISKIELLRNEIRSFQMHFADAVMRVDDYLMPAVDDESSKDHPDIIYKIVETLDQHARYIEMEALARWREFCGGPKFGRLTHTIAIEFRNISGRLREILFDHTPLGDDVSSASCAALSQSLIEFLEASQPIIENVADQLRLVSRYERRRLEDYISHIEAIMSKDISG